MLLSPCNCTGFDPVKAISLEAGVKSSVPSELALSQPLLLLREGVLGFPFCTEKNRGKFLPRLWFAWFVVPLPRSESQSPDCLKPFSWGFPPYTERK